MLRRPTEVVPGQGKKIVRMQPGVELLDMHKWLNERGYECSFCPGEMLSFCRPPQWHRHADGHVGSVVTTSAYL